MTHFHVIGAINEQLASMFAKSVNLPTSFVINKTLIKDSN